MSRGSPIALAERFSAVLFIGRGGMDIGSIGKGFRVAGDVDLLVQNAIIRRPALLLMERGPF